MTVEVKVGQVWMAMVPFGERADGKNRPVVILGWNGFSSPRGDAHFLVVPAFTFGGDPNAARDSDISLADWSCAGLSQGSFVRCARLWSLPPAAFHWGKGQYGTLDNRDLDRVLAEVSNFFGAAGSVSV